MKSLNLYGLDCRKLEVTRSLLRVVMKVPYYSGTEFGTVLNRVQQYGSSRVRQSSTGVSTVRNRERGDRCSTEYGTGISTIRRLGPARHEVQYGVGAVRYVRDGLYGTEYGTGENVTE